MTKRKKYKKKKDQETKHQLINNKFKNVNSPTDFSLQRFSRIF